MAAKPAAHSWIAAFTVVVFAAASAAALPSDWRNQQPIQIPSEGLVKLSLPAETLDKSRSNLEDLRVYDAENHEIPYLIDRPAPTGKLIHRADSFQVSLQSDSTVITFDGLSQRIDGITLETPASGFIKAVRIEGSPAAGKWQTLAEGQPIFRQPWGAANLYIPLQPAVWRKLRVTVDDKRSQPIPFTSAILYGAEPEPTPVESAKATISSRDENPGETRLTVNLAAAHLDLVSLRIETSEPLFMRHVNFSESQVVDELVREQSIGSGSIFRISVEGRPPSASLTVPIERHVNSRELIVLIRNEDSPPLPISAVRVERRPVYLIFRARTAGTHYLLTGNARCSAPHYDLAALGGNFKGLSVATIQIPAASPNPDFREADTLPELRDGIALDTAAWKFRKPVKIKQSGAQQLELDMDVLSRAGTHLQDLRLVRNGKQVSYVLARTSITRSLTPTVTSAPDKKVPDLSRWQLKLPRPALPLNRLTCTSRSTLFDRQFSLYEELTDDRAGTYRNPLGSSRWVRTPDSSAREFGLAIDNQPQSDTLLLETHNGDNPPIEIADVRMFYPATRVLFKTESDDGLFLYYDNPSASAPNYDIALVAGKLLAAEKSDASSGLEEKLKTTWRDTRPAGKGGVIFWGILGLVVVILLFVISRLLPKPPAPQSGTGGPASAA